MTSFEIRTPDPGKGWRIVQNITETPHPLAEFWSGVWNRWLPRDERHPYHPYFIYRVPDDQPVLGLPDIKVCEDQWFNEQYEQGRPEAVIVWMFIVLGGLLLFLLGFGIGRLTA